MFPLYKLQHATNEKFLTLAGSYLNGETNLAAEDDKKRSYVFWTDEDMSDLIDLIKENPGITIKELTQNFLFGHETSRSTLYNNIRELIRSGIVEKKKVLEKKGLIIKNLSKGLTNEK